MLTIDYAVTVAIPVPGAATKSAFAYVTESAAKAFVPGPHVFCTHCTFPCRLYATVKLFAAAEFARTILEFTVPSGVL